LFARIWICANTGKAMAITTRVAGMANTNRKMSLRPRMDGVWDGEAGMDESTIYY
jgi:hypothetical protein